MNNYLRWSTTILFTLVLLTGCGGGGGGDSTAPTDPTDLTTGSVSAPEVTLGYDTKTLNFSWAAVEGASHYKLFEDPDGGSGYTQVGGDISATSYAHEIALHRRINAKYQVEACNSDDSCTGSSEIFMTNYLVDAIGHFKALNPDMGDKFGTSVALSEDGNTLAVGAQFEDSSATGINGDETDNSSGDSGAVYVFRRVNGIWAQEAYLKAMYPGVDDSFGYSISLSDDGTILAVGARYEDSAADSKTCPDGGEYGYTCIDEQQSDALDNVGAAYVFSRSATGEWKQEAYVKPPYPGLEYHFGQVVALSGDGNTLAVSSPVEKSSGTGINSGMESNIASVSSGAVFLYQRSNELENPNTGEKFFAWTYRTYVKASDSADYAYFGKYVSLSNDGNTMAVANDASGFTVVDKKVYVFQRDTNYVWSEQAILPFENVRSIAISGDGNTLVVGDTFDDSGSTGINGDRNNYDAPDSGAAFVYARSAGVWQEQAYFKASNTDTDDKFGFSVALSTDGNTLAVGALNEDSLATGINGDETDNSGLDKGAAYVYTRSAGVWSQQAYVKASNTSFSRLNGWSIALDGGGDTLAVGASDESSPATGINGEGTEGIAGSGAVYLY